MENVSLMYRKVSEAFPVLRGGISRMNNEEQQGMTSTGHIYEAEYRNPRLRWSERESASCLISGTSTLSAFSATAYIAAMILPRTNERKTLASTILKLCTQMTFELLVYHASQRPCSYRVVVWPAHVLNFGDGAGHVHVQS